MQAPWHVQDLYNQSCVQTKHMDRGNLLSGLSTHVEQKVGGGGLRPRLGQLLAYSLATRDYCSYTQQVIFQSSH